METDTNLMSKNEGIVSILNVISVVLRTEATEILLEVGEIRAFISASISKSIFFVAFFYYVKSLY